MRSPPKRVASRIHRAQRVVDGLNTEVRQTLTRYSGIVEQQRLALRRLREDLLSAPAEVFGERVPAQKSNAPAE